MMQSLLVLSIVLLGLNASADVSITVGKGDFYVSVGDYDYLPYGDTYGRLPRISFYDMMGQYGTWVNAYPFGRAWRPYVYYDWQPFTYGHWVYTQYGPTWIGYEPWAWAAYHYGNWIWTPQYSWVWLPGYQWHPGRVIWSYSYNTIGWMPAPPQGYNYFCGYLCPDRSNRYGGYGNVYSRSNDDFVFDDYNDYEDYNDYSGYDDDNYGNQGYGNSGYDYEHQYDSQYGYDPYSDYSFYYDPYLFNSAYIRIAPKLWVFIPTQYYTSDDYSAYYFDSDYNRYLFDRRLVQINRNEMDRPTLERVVQQRIQEQPVRVKELQTEKQVVKVVVPESEEREVRAHANRVVKEVIAPAFAEKGKGFKGANAKNKDVMARVFKQQEGRQPQVETLDRAAVERDAKQARENRHAKRQEVVKRGIENLQRAEREGKLKGFEKARERAEKREKTGSSNQDAPAKAKKRTVENERGNAPEKPQNFEKWKDRETAKFEKWKEAQVKKFEAWKQANATKSTDELKKAEADFQDKLKRAEAKFQERTKRSEQESR
jgi:hypothetical protein